jgi:methionine-rich copper-binding protein CopC
MTFGTLRHVTSPTALRRSMLALAAVFGSFLLAPATAQAHTDFDYSLPADGASVGEPVEEITVAFTLPVTLVRDGFAVLDPQNNELAPVALTDDDTVFRLQFDPPLTGGTVAVKYEVRAEDGHVLTGNFVFVVEAPIQTTMPPTTAAPIATSAPTAAQATTTSTTVVPTSAPVADAEPAVDAAATPVADLDDDNGGSGPWVFIAVGAAVVLGAGGFLLVRSRTSRET